MPVTAQPWTDVDEQLRHKILGAAQARGVTHRELAEAAGVNEVKLHRWSKKAAHLTDQQIAKMAELLKAAPTRVDATLAQEANAAQVGAFRPAPGGAAQAGSIPPGPSAPGPVPEGVRRALEVLENLAGPMPTADEQSLQALARRHGQAAIGTFVRLMVGAKSDSVKAHSAAMILERGFGRPVHAVIDLTPQPPAGDHELMAVFRKINGEADSEEAAP
jgi:hypothetical protein